MDMLKRQSGFSLLEVMIALVILAVALLALAGLMTTSTAYNASGSRVTEASVLAQDKLEEFRAMRWDDVQATPPGPETDPVSKIGSTGIVYTRNWNVAQNGNIKTITITVNWNDRIDHSIRLVSAISK